MKAKRWLLLVLLGTGCAAGDSDEDREAARAEVQEDGRVATAMASGSERLSAEELEAGRMRMDWRQWVERDTAAADTAQPELDESWDDITVESVNRGPVVLPVFGDVAGPSVLRVQILLDRARFSPGIIDGRWGSNTE
ncbi:MAG TPA: hypothetical protein VFZ24_18145, partial [Longimicrobiales bacterium]